MRTVTAKTIFPKTLAAIIKRKNLLPTQSNPSKIFVGLFYVFFNPCQLWLPLPSISSISAQPMSTFVASSVSNLVLSTIACIATSFGLHASTVVSSLYCCCIWALLPAVTSSGIAMFFIYNSLDTEPAPTAIYCCNYSCWLLLVLMLLFCCCACSTLLLRWLLSTIYFLCWCCFAFATILLLLRLLYFVAVVVHRYTLL